MPDRATFTSVLPDAQKEMCLGPQSRTCPVFRKTYSHRKPVEGIHSLCVSHKDKEVTRHSRLLALTAEMGRWQL